MNQYKILYKFPSHKLLVIFSDSCHVFMSLGVKVFNLVVMVDWIGKSGVGSLKRIRM